MSVALLLTNNLDNSKQKTSTELAQRQLHLPTHDFCRGKSAVEGPAPPPSSKISRSFDLAWNPGDDSVAIGIYNPPTPHPLLPIVPGLISLMAVNVPDVKDSDLSIITQVRHSVEEG